MASPGTFSVLSFLTAAGHGPVTVDYRIYHADGTSESGLFVALDWFFNNPVVWNAQGRVDVVSGTFNNVANNNPRLYSEDIILTNTTSLVTNISLSWDPGNSGSGVAAIFAVSGAAPLRLPFNLTFNISGGLMTLTWSNNASLLEAASVLGPWITNNAAASPYQVMPNAPARFYRLQVR